MRQPRRTERVLRATQRLLVARGAAGASSAEVARRALVPRGFVDRHWPTPAALLGEVVARELVDLVDHCTVGLAAQPARVLPPDFCAYVARYVVSRPVALTLHGDPDLPAALAGTSAERLLIGWRGIATAGGMLGLWRRHGVVDAGAAVRRQTLGLRAIMQVELGAEPSRGWAPWAAPRGGTARLECAVGALFDPSEVDREVVEAATAATLRSLEVWRREARRHTGADARASAGGPAGALLCRSSESTGTR